MENKKYYCVGFHWYSQNPTNQLPRFIKENVWENGYDNKFLDTVKNVPEGSRLAAKTSYIRKEKGEIISVLEVHALGTVMNNHKDGRTLDVSWDKDFKSFTLDGRGAYRSTISQVNDAENIKLIFENQKNDKTVSRAALSFDPNDLTDNFSSNLILYGPPGTGKTFNTISKAISIADGIKEEKLLLYYKDRTALKDRFDELLIDDWENPTGQIAFVTFHQSFSYEDFVEGIKPEISKIENGQLVYKIEDGIFKKICKSAAKRENKSINLEKKEVELTEEVFENLYYSFAETLTPVTEENSNCELKTPDGYKFGLFRNSAGSISVKSGWQKTKMSVSFNELRKVFFEKRLPLYRSYEQQIIDKILESWEYKETIIENEKKRYVLIIDEINRGNISQIFGELITLIEEDKRTENTESLSLILPYSKLTFSVPSNLYIIGTMNTADRSVEALDTALRRRFVFEEKEPQPELLTPERMVWQLWWDYKSKEWDDPEYAAVEELLYTLLGFPTDLNEEDKKETYWAPMKEQGINPEQVKALSSFDFIGIDLSKLLIHINKRIEKLLSKDYRIGHAYLIKIGSVDDLRKVFQNKILPLLQEYFFGDYGRIGLVLGEAFIKSTEPEQKVDLMKVSGYETGDLNDIKTYQIQNVAEWDEPTFIKNVKAIYGE